MALFDARGKASHFGGPKDTGVTPSEGLAFFEHYDQAPWLFLDKQPAGTTGLARRLNPEVHYIACRWDYGVTPKSMLRQRKYQALVSVGAKQFAAWPADWGPNTKTDRVADLSPGLMEALGIKTDDIVSVSYPMEEILPTPPPEIAAMPKIAISSGHGTKIQGASGIINEVKEATKVVDRVAAIIASGGGSVVKFHDTVSTSQSQNLNRIIGWHNSQTRDFDVSVHFNAYQPTDRPMGTECLYVTQSSLAAKVSSAQASAGGFINRGAKKRTDLAFLNGTAKPSILTEVCFVDSAADVGLYEGKFEEICQAIAFAIVPNLQVPGEPPLVEPPTDVEKVVNIQIHAPPGVRVDVAIDQDDQA